MNTTASASPVPDLRLGSLFARSWQVFKARAGFLALASLVTCLLPTMGMWYLGTLAQRPDAQGHLAGGAAFLNGALQVGGNMVCYLLYLGLLFVAMRLWHGEPARFAMLGAVFGRPWRFLGLALLGVVAGAVLSLGAVAGAAAVQGFGRAGILFALLGLGGMLFLLSCFSPAMVVLLETDLGVWAACRLSWRLTRGDRGRMVLLLVVTTAMEFAGAATLLVGMLVTVPVATLMLAGACDELVLAYAARTGAVAPAG